jgi:hypothetical protein
MLITLPIFVLDLNPYSRKIVHDFNNIFLADSLTIFSATSLETVFKELYLSLLIYIGDERGVSLVVAQKYFFKYIGNYLSGRLLTTDLCSSEFLERELILF